MTNEAREKRNAYRRAWYARNKDKARAQQERYWERQASQCAAGDQIREQTEQAPQG